MEFLVCEFVAFGDRNDLLNRVLGCDRVNIELCLVTDHTDDRNFFADGEMGL